LYYDQGDGLRVLYGFTYKYLTLEHFLGQFTRLQVGTRLANALAHGYAQAWYPDQTSLYLFADWHIKPHWTKAYSHAGHVTMWGRTLPGTKQLILNGTNGEILGGWNYAIDAHLTHVLVNLEAELSQTLQREIYCSTSAFSPATTSTRWQTLPWKGLGNPLSMIHNERRYSRVGRTSRKQSKTPVNSRFCVALAKPNPRVYTRAAFDQKRWPSLSLGYTAVVGPTTSGVSVT
jgi:hypothetical protein